MRALTRSGSVFSGLVLAACSLLGAVDDLEGNGSPADGGSDAASSDGSSSCLASSGCLGCPSCAAYCQCTKPFAVEGCVAECEDSGAAGGGAGGSAGSAGHAGSAGSAGSSGSSGSSGSAGENCNDDKYVGASCTDTDTSSECGQCLVTNCCIEIDGCFSDESCAEAYACWENECPSPDPNCALSKCSPCIGTALSQLSAFADCAQQLCATDCAATP